MHTVRYDDGEEKTYNMHHKTFRIVSCRNIMHMYVDCESFLSQEGSPYLWTPDKIADALERLKPAKPVTSATTATVSSYSNSNYNVYNQSSQAYGGTTYGGYNNGYGGSTYGNAYGYQYSAPVRGPPFVTR
jgi:hypothetical protein